MDVERKDANCIVGPDDLNLLNYYCKWNKLCHDLKISHDQMRDVNVWQRSWSLDLIHSASLYRCQLLVKHVSACNVCIITASLTHLLNSRRRLKNRLSLITVVHSHTLRWCGGANEMWPIVLVKEKSTQLEHIKSRKKSSERKSCGLFREKVLRAHTLSFLLSLHRWDNLHTWDGKPAGRLCTCCSETLETSFHWASRAGLYMCFTWNQL